MEKKPLHVLPGMDGGWVIRRSGSTRATKHFETQNEAEDYARQISHAQKLELVIHRRDGTIKSKDSYGHDPQPPVSQER